ncbi:MAG: hypothetical protein J6U54_11355 [Clostridiales bacterium]|nr:hypothetical protein [Clostridiales bacterium]
MNIKQEYFNWMVNLVNATQYRRLLKHLYSTPFYYIIPMDHNRVEDGVNLRYRWGRENDIPDPAIACELDCQPCSVLEMMLALAIRVEENIMEDPDLGNRTSKWFWDMIVNLNLGGQNDIRYNEYYVSEALTKFMERNYKPDGSDGGLFTIANPRDDLRRVEIWYQAMWYLTEQMKGEQHEGLHLL